jgi:hypothetical protein
VLALLTVALVAAALAAFLLARGTARLLAGRGRSRGGATSPLAFDPGRERRAEQRARELLRSCVNEREWAMYRDLGFIRVPGRRLPDAADPDGQEQYAYLIYPHKPLVAYAPATGRLLSEYCVEFPDMADGRRARLPASDDVLAKWMALSSDEARVIGRANMNLVGRQHDPARVRRDIWRLSEWERQRDGQRLGAQAA